MSGADDHDDEKLLSDSFSALRETTAESAAKAPEAAATRRRLLIAATSRRRRKTVVVRYVLPLAAVLAVSSAWAAATGRLPRVIQSVSEIFRSTPERDEDRRTSSGTASASAVATMATSVPTSTTASNDPTPTASASTDPPSSIASNDPIPPTTPATPAQKPSAPTTAAPTPTTTSASTATSTATSASGPASAQAAVDPEEAEYRKAHEAHFVAKDWNKALSAWDAYLAAHPKGRFAPEARYNRGLTLIRLNRRAEAKQALEPFANGAFGTYRQKEAKQLLEALE